METEERVWTPPIETIVVQVVKKRRGFRGYWIGYGPVLFSQGVGWGVRGRTVERVLEKLVSEVERDMPALAGNPVSVDWRGFDG